MTETFHKGYMLRKKNIYSDDFFLVCYACDNLLCNNKNKENLSTSNI